MVPFFANYAKQVLLPETLAALQQHAADAYPQECVGAVLDDNSYVRLTNVATEPEAAFEVADAEMVQYADRVRMIHHSEPMTTAEATGRDNWYGTGPSVEDQECQKRWACPFALTRVIDSFSQETLFWGDGLPMAPLIGRPFVHSIYDCLSLVRDVHATEFGIHYENPVRGFGWWDQGQDLYAENFKKWGFEEIGLDELKRGDVILAMIGSKVLNHGAVWLGDGLIIHHLRAQLSRREPIGHWRRYVCRAVRWAGLVQEKPAEAVESVSLPAPEPEVAALPPKKARSRKIKAVE